MPKLKRLINQNSHYIFMALGIFLLVKAIANFANLPWVVKPRGRNDRWLYSKLGPTGFRIFFGVFDLIFAGLCFLALKVNGNI